MHVLFLLRNFYKTSFCLINKMKYYTGILELKTGKELEFLNITEKIKQIVKKSGIQKGFVNLFSKHTTLAIKINEYEELLLKDLDWLMKRIAPEKKKFFHDIIQLRKNCPSDEPKNARGHLRSILLETSQTIPIMESEMQLGTYQQIFAVETSGPRERQILVNVFGE
jgi:secondary thiamine-phosphate synthase enzyme